MLRFVLQQERYVQHDAWSTPFARGAELIQDPGTNPRVDPALQPAPLFRLRENQVRDGFPIGGVAAFDPAEGGVVSAGGVGFDISCGVRTMLTGLRREAIEPFKQKLADALFARVPAGVGSTGQIRLDETETNAMLLGGAAWAVERGYGRPEDLERIEEGGTMAGADPDAVSARAKRRQRDEMGTLGSGNHYLEVQEIAEIFDRETAAGFGLELGTVVVSIHCGSRGLGHQVCQDSLSTMAS